MKESSSTTKKAKAARRASTIASASAMKRTKKDGKTAPVKRKRAEDLGDGSASEIDAAADAPADPPTKRSKNAPSEAKALKKRKKGKKVASDERGDADDASASEAPLPSSPVSSAANADNNDVPTATSSAAAPFDLDAMLSPPRDPKLAKSMASLANKLTGSNLETMVTEIEHLYRDFPRADVTAALIHRLVASISEKTDLQHTFVIPYAALLSCIGTVMGSDVCAQVVHVAVLQWLRLKDSNDEEHHRACRNMLTLLGFLYNFHIVSCAIIYDLLRALSEGMSEEQLTMILRLIKLCGLKLLDDDAAVLKDIADHVRAAATRALPDPVPLRVKFMLETLDDIKHSKHRRTMFTNMADEPLTKFCAQFHRNRGRAARMEPLRPSLEDIVNAKSRGMWWRVGSAWRGHDSDKIQQQVQARAKQSESALLKLARKQNMNTDVRRSIFVVMMSSEDYMDAYERLGKLGLKEKQEREIARVIVHCVGQEKAYNPFYAVLAQKFCARHDNKITFQFTLWDYLKLDPADDGIDDDLDLDDPPATKPVQKYLRRLKQTARLYAHLLATAALPPAILRVLDPVRLTPHQVRFVRVFTWAVRRAIRELPAGADVVGDKHDNQGALNLTGAELMDGAHVRRQKTATSVARDVLRVVEGLEQSLVKYHGVSLRN
ncbi:hypothetical protein AMAG_01473 [Allomyces macrogynus ATCC 38327]|uniref:MI domain-containing protein n=1 Tax=Allomyces macrogynus (strain ATCC 38327) TaxID=578462 RepID=A0A0L0RYW7_ALLM3|nr:hypothetical protein AMAG_01473 [Allomyces macrogynus ATCC 38327]|eukprot:KNE55582.1 hypothetical protein AMAG_01473 [Allomyces macrogynus ATCC 38327]